MGWGTWLGVQPAPDRSQSLSISCLRNPTAKSWLGFPDPWCVVSSPDYPSDTELKTGMGVNEWAFSFSNTNTQIQILKCKHTNTSSQVRELKTGMGICQLVCYCRNGNWNWVSWQLFWICCSNGHWHWHWTAFLHFCPSIRMLSPLSSHALVSGGRCLV